MEALANVSLMEEQGDSQEGKYLSFLIGKEEYAVEIRFVTEIIGMQKITILPDLPVFVKGVINLRGKVIPAIDVRLRFGLDERTYDDRTCIVITRLNDSSVGLIVDSVSEVLDIPQNNIDPPPRIRKGSESRFIKGLGKLGSDVKIILDTHKLLFEEELEKIETSIV
jgi:purine-binding chemotaxis protein CheW